MRQNFLLHITLQKHFKTEYIKYIVECLNEEFERYVMVRLKWKSKPKIESALIILNFPFSVVFVYSKNYFNNNESRYCWQTLS